MPQREEPDLDQVRDALRQHDERQRTERGDEDDEPDEQPDAEPAEDD